jgi:DNA-binding MarR family transcriptional regulator
MEQDDIGYLLNRATRQLRLELGEALSEIGLRPQQAAVLMAIARSQQDRLTPSQVADAIDTDAATTSGLLERLTRDGWLTSEPNPDDGRSRLVALSKQAQHVLPKVMASAEAVSTTATACLSPGELETLGQLLRRICNQGDAKITKAGAR